MRTPQKIVRHMLSVARRELGVKTYAELWDFIAKAEHSIERKLAIPRTSVTLSPYKDSRWAASCVADDPRPGVCRWIEIATTFEEIADNRTALAKRISVRLNTPARV